MKIENLRSLIRESINEYINKIDAMGGSVQAIEDGYIQDEIAGSAYRYQNDIESGDKIIVGVNKFTAEEKPIENIFVVDDNIRVQQIAKLNQLKSERDNQKVTLLLQKLDADARANVNLMPSILEACEQYATLGEIADTFRNVFGEYKTN